MNAEETVITLTIVHEEGVAENILDHVESWDSQCGAECIQNVEAKTRRLLPSIDPKGEWHPTRKVRA